VPFPSLACPVFILSYIKLIIFPSVNPLLHTYMLRVPKFVALSLYFDKFWKQMNIIRISSPIPPCPLFSTFSFHIQYVNRTIVLLSPLVQLLLLPYSMLYIIIVVPERVGSDVGARMELCHPKCGVWNDHYSTVEGW
jgi:hypothetical protein